MERIKELAGTGEGDESFNVFDLTAFYLLVFRLVVGVGKKFANGGDAGTSVRAAHRIFGIKSVLNGPA